MKEQRKTEIKVGIVSILSLALLILGITLGKDFSVGVSQITITMEFPRSGGIAPSAPVVVNGVKRGAVSQVRNHNGNVRITAEIDDISDFRTDAAAMITTMEITGGKKIDISP
ncbi:MAG: MlaD family protein, partial [Bacteroidota bacterium]